MAIAETYESVGKHDLALEMSHRAIVACSSLTSDFAIRAFRLGHIGGLVTAIAEWRARVNAEAKRNRWEDVAADYFFRLIRWVAQQAMKEGQLEPAVQLMEEAVNHGPGGNRDGPDYWAFIYLLGTAYKRAGAAERQWRLYEDAIQMGTTHLRIFRDYIAQLKKQHEYARALSSVEIGLRNAPDIALQSALFEIQTQLQKKLKLKIGPEKPKFIGQADDATLRVAHFQVKPKPKGFTVVGSHAMFIAGDTERCCILCHDSQTGEKLWEAKLPENAAHVFGTPDFVVAVTNRGGTSNLSREL